MSNSKSDVQPTSKSGNAAKLLVSRRFSKWDLGFSAGFAAACAITQMNHGCDTIVEDTLRCNFMDEAEMRRRGVDDYDIEILKPIIKEIKRKLSLNGG